MMGVVFNEENLKGFKMLTHKLKYLCLLSLMGFLLLGCNKSDETEVSQNGDLSLSKMKELKSELDKAYGEDSNGKSTYLENVDYSWASDGSCKPRENTVCLTENEYEKICLVTKGVSKYSLKVAAVMASHVERTLLEGGNLESMSVTWGNSQSGKGRCYASVTVSGIVDGNSARKVVDGIAKRFQKNAEGEILVAQFGWY